MKTLETVHDYYWAPQETLLRVGAPGNRYYIEKRERFWHDDRTGQRWTDGEMAGRARAAVWTPPNSWPWSVS